MLEAPEDPMERGEVLLPSLLLTPLLLGAHNRILLTDRYQSNGLTLAGSPGSLQRGQSTPGQKTRVGHPSVVQHHRRRMKTPGARRRSARKSCMVGPTTHPMKGWK